MSRIDQYPQAGAALGGFQVVGNDVADATEGANGSTKRVYADQMGALASGTVPGGIVGLQAAVAQCDTQRVDIPIIGDSITEGQGATAFTSRWIARANKWLRTAVGQTTGGLGFIPLVKTGEASYTWPVVLASGGSGLEGFDLGPVRNTDHIFAAASYTYTAPAGTSSVKIMYYDAPVAGSFTYKVGSGSATTVTNGSTQTDKLTASITLTSGQVLTIAWVSGDVFVDGLLHFASDESAGVTLHGCGHYGWTVADWTAAEPDGFNWYTALNAFSAPAFGILLGANDASTSGGNRTASQFASDVTTLISDVRTNATTLASAPVLLIACYQSNDTYADSGGWPAYVAALRGVAGADAHGAHVIDLSYPLPSVASGGSLYADTVHPSNAGHALIGKITAAGLRV